MELNLAQFITLDKCYGATIKDTTYVGNMGVNIRLNNRYCPVIQGFGDGLLIQYGKPITDNEFNTLIEANRIQDRMQDRGTFETVVPNRDG